MLIVPVLHAESTPYAAHLLDRLVDVGGWGPVVLASEGTFRRRAESLTLAGWGV